MLLHLIIIFENIENITLLISHLVKLGVCSVQRYFLSQNVSSYVCFMTV